MPYERWPAMKFRKDVILLPKEYPFDYFTARGSDPSSDTLHYHDCLEINYIISGSGTNIIEQQKHIVKPGDIFIINNLEHHLAFSEGDLNMRVIVFDPWFIWQQSSFDYGYLLPFYERLPHFGNLIERDHPIYDQLSAILDEIDAEWQTRSEGYRLIIKALLMKLLALFYRHLKGSGDTSIARSTFSRSYDRIRPSIELIHEAFDQELTLQHLADQAAMSRSYFSVQFKTIIGMNASEYLERIRIEKACQLLRTTRKSIAEICNLCGYSNISHFNKVFRRRTHRTPTAYRNTMTL